MISNMTRAAFEASIIAQDDDKDYSESGFVAVVVGDEAGLSKYGHCSCYGTWDDLTDRSQQYGWSGEEAPPLDVRWDWKGTPDELVAMAKRDGDPYLPERIADPNDYDYDHLAAVYKQIIEWDANGRKTNMETGRG